MDKYPNLQGFLKVYRDLHVITLFSALIAISLSMGSFYRLGKKIIHP